MLKLGFANAFEVAEGAHLVKSAYEKIVAEDPDHTLITSACTSINYYIKCHRPEAAKYLLPVLTPMRALAKLLRKRYPEAKFVFIGPWLSKKEKPSKTAVMSLLCFFLRNLKNGLPQKKSISMLTNHFAINLD